MSISSTAWECWTYFIIRPRWQWDFTIFFVYCRCRLVMFQDNKNCFNLRKSRQKQASKQTKSKRKKTLDKNRAIDTWVIMSPDVMIIDYINSGKASCQSLTTSKLTQEAQNSPRNQNVGRPRSEWFQDHLQFQIVWGDTALPGSIKATLKADCLVEVWNIFSQTLCRKGSNLRLPFAFKSVLRPSDIARPV